MSAATLRTPDGQALALRDWPLPAGAVPRAVAQIVRGIGEHAAGRSGDFLSQIGL